MRRTRPSALRRTLIAAAMILGLAGPAAAADTYVCQLSQHGGGNWIPEVLFIGRDDPSAPQAVVSDPVVLYFNKGPVAARVAADNASRVTFVWELTVEAGARSYVSRFIYRATYLKGSGRMQISATPAGYSNRFTGSGTCRYEQR
ncbi:hypothetical protein LVO79_07995 [Roseivivax marinus]|uniref:hypothetical protein n=1 Tax=Roseivivax marinus TaxID=1379903 RepID=UPI001F03470F|nr:hypothetical protein [Roseivivax marinus]UMA66374.1 hypothetical protein LVO79_07995 [Roseivivax marinus]